MPENVGFYRLHSDEAGSMGAVVSMEPARPRAWPWARLARSSLLRLISKRLLQGIVVVWGVTFITYTLMNLLPGGSAVALAGDGASAEQIHQLELKLHLNQPLLERYWHWLSSVVTGHLGASLASGQPVSAILAQRLPVTAELVILSMAISVVVSIPISILAARKPQGIADRVNMSVTMFGLSVPDFVLGFLLILLFSVHWRLFPALGYKSISTGLWRNLHTLVLPSVTLAFHLLCRYTRVLRADLLDQLAGRDYIATATAKGLSPWRVLSRHALKNSMFNLLTVVGLNTGALIGGTVLIEEIFALPGIGQELIQAAMTEDVVVVEAIVIIMAAAVVAANLVTDLLYSALDPRVRYGRAIA